MDIARWRWFQRHRCSQYELWGKLAEILISEAKFLERIQSPVPFWDPAVFEGNADSTWHSQMQQQCSGMIFSTLKTALVSWALIQLFHAVSLLAECSIWLGWCLSKCSELLTCQCRCGLCTKFRFLFLSKSSGGEQCWFESPGKGGW